MTGLEIGIVILLAAAGATVQGSIGIGYGLVAGPGLVAIDPSFAPGPLLVAGVIVGSRLVIEERESIDKSAVGSCLIGLPFGLVSGLMVLSAMGDQALGISVGVATCMAAIAMLFGFSVTRSRAVEIAAGAATAFSAVTAGLPGPPFVVAFSDLKPAALRASASLFISLIAVLSLIGMIITGRFASEEAELLAWMVPGSILGLIASRPLRPYLERPGFRPLVLIVAAVGGLALVLRNL